jgi:hypothetical protein
MPRARRSAWHRREPNGTRSPTSVSIMDEGVMGVSERSSASLGTFAGHAQHVCSVAEGASPLPGIEEISKQTLPA